ncbi:hypothetical protein JAAARDRAFT_671449 [Jaapia argillacea MUCL 33604]|uniref:Uncharacterized protein n=1 Tax=Jaapia argillacea MUCL 33604 TaxID=933084 RepID=A0A067PUP1_9AGAM|nr:hypothetical protein JAAARDRAFT_671449 [Jaapia argillacea MUCL 33604]
MVVGRASGKRTLADVMDQESEAKKKKLKGTTVGEGGRPTIAHSRFFGGSPAIPAPSPIGGPPNAGNLRVEGFEKENIDIEEIDLAIYVDDDIITEESRVDDGVEQEDGYISPSPSMNEDTPELSSPLRPEQSRGGGWDEEDDFDGAEVLSSPIAARTSSAANHSLREVPKSAHLEKGKRVGGLTMMMPLADSVSRSDGCEQNEVGVDLQDIFGDDSADDLSSQIDPDETSPPDNSFSSSNSASTSESSSGPVTPDDHRSLFSPDDDDGQRPHVDFDMDDIDVEECEAKESKVRREIVANGWWERWARGRGDVDCAGQQRPPRKLAPLRRMETTVTPIGRKSKNTLSVSARLPRLTATSGQKSVAASVKSNRTMHSEPRPPRKSLVFFQESAPFGASDRSAMLGEGDAMIGSTSMNPDASEDLGAQARSRLAQFRISFV